MRWLATYSYRAVLLTFCVYGLWSEQLFASEIVITEFRTAEDSIGTRRALDVREGKDFFSTELKNPIDGKDKADIGWYEQYLLSSVRTKNGVWRAESVGPGAYLFPLFGGFGGALSPEPLPGDTSLPKHGYAHPVPTSSYTQLSFKLSQTHRSTLAVYWKEKLSDPNAHRWPDGSHYFAVYDVRSVAEQTLSEDGYAIYSFDLLNLPVPSSGRWAGLISALRLDPSISAPPSAKTKLDWLRLTNPSSAPWVQIAWSKTQVPEWSVTTLWIDSNAADFNGVPVMQFPTTNQHRFPSALLPPGGYYFYLTVHDGSRTQLLARSAYSPRLRILSAPQVAIHDPSATSGKDYFTKNGNPADMSDASDVRNLDTAIWSDQWRQFQGAQFENGSLSFFSDPPWYHVGNAQSDVQVHLAVSSTQQIQPNKQRYLIYRMKLKDDDYQTLSQAVAQGFVARPVFWNNDIQHGSVFKAHAVYPGYRSYVIDLWDPSAIAVGSYYLAHDSFVHFRLDPNENTSHVPLETWIDDVMLTAEPKPEDGRFSITWSIDDHDSSQFTTTLYYSTDPNATAKTQIAKLSGLSPGLHTYSWKTSQLQAGTRYYVVAKVSDGVNTRKAISTVPILR